MIIECAHCPFVATSLIIDKDAALKESIDAFLKHFMKQHPNEHIQVMKDTQKTTAISASVITFAKHTRLLDKELDATDYLQEQFHNMINEIQDALGVEVMDAKPEDSKPISIIDIKS